LFDGLAVPPLSIVAIFNIACLEIQKPLASEKNK
jgi:hypothetical protein